MTKYEVWSLVISAVSLVASAVIAVLAIWGDLIRHQLTPPKLRIDLRNTKGELADQYGRKARYYHLIVSNKRDWVTATNVAVFLTRIDRLNGGSTWQTAFETGPIPLVWQYAAHYKGNGNIGKERFCDFGFMQEDVKCFTMSLEFVPEGMNCVLRPGEHMRVHLIAVADNTKSPPLVLELSWDGQWHDSCDEMARHLRVTKACC